MRTLYGYPKTYLTSLRATRENRHFAQRAKKCNTSAVAVTFQLSKSLPFLPFSFIDNLMPLHCRQITSSRRLGEVGGATAHNSDNHRRLKDATEIRIITSPPNFAKPLVIGSVSLFLCGKFSVVKTTASNAVTLR